MRCSIWSITFLVCCTVWCQQSIFVQQCYRVQKRCNLCKWSSNVMWRLKWRQWSSHDSSSVKENGEVNVTVAVSLLLMIRPLPTCRDIMENDPWKTDMVGVLSEFDSCADKWSCSQYGVLRTVEVCVQGFCPLRYVNLQYSISTTLSLWWGFQKLWPITVH